MYAVTDEKFASDDEEQDNPGDDLGKGFVQTEHGRNFVCSATHEDEHKEEVANMTKAIENNTLVIQKLVDSMDDIKKG